MSVVYELDEKRLQLLMDAVDCYQNEGTSDIETTALSCEVEDELEELMCELQIRKEKVKNK